MIWLCDYTHMQTTTIFIKSGQSVTHSNWKLLWQQCSLTLINLSSLHVGGTNCCQHKVMNVSHEDSSRDLTISSVGSGKIIFFLLFYFFFTPISIRCATQHVLSIYFVFAHKMFYILNMDIWTRPHLHCICTSIYISFPLQSFFTF